MRSKFAKPELVSTKEAAQMIGVSTMTLFRWRKERRGPKPINKTGWRKYTLTSILDFIAGGSKP